ncbi:MAG: WhiB family transcriptional regulator [Actinomycetota bacterium]
MLGPCRQHALAHREWYGVWGRLGERERQAMQRGTEHQSSVMR